MAEWNYPRMVRMTVGGKVRVENAQEHAALEGVKPGEEESALRDAAKNPSESEGDADVEIEIPKARPAQTRRK